MKDAIRIELAEPVTVALAPPDVRGWGPYQFPSLARLPDGRIQLSFHVEADSAAAYGLPPARAVSDDEGWTWLLLPRDRVGGGTMLSWGSGALRLPNGDWLNVKQLRSKPAGELQLPATPFATYRSYSRDGAIYRLEDLPEEYRAGWMLLRLPAGETEWVEEQAAVDLPGPVRGVIDGVMSFPWFQQMFVAPDGAVWAVNHNKRVIAGRYQEKISVIVQRSTDHGRTWVLWGEIPYAGDSDADPAAPEREGFTEPTVCFMPDGSVFCLLRTTDGSGVGPMYWTRSTDNGRTWSPPAVFDDRGVWPQMLTLKCGITLAIYGRPGLYVRATADPAGLRWGERVEIVPPDDHHQNTCSYAALLELDDDTALAAYSDFNLENADGMPCKGIRARRVRATKGPDS